MKPSIHSFMVVAAILASICLFSGCNPPRKAFEEDPPFEKWTPPPPPPPPKSEPTQAEGSVGNGTEMPPASPSRPPNTQWPELVVSENEETKTFLLRGEMRDQKQIERFVRNLAIAFPEWEPQVEIETGDHVRGVAWGNRVSAYWVDFFKHVENGEWEYADGVTTLRGRCSSQRDADTLHRMVVDFMEGPDAKDIDNQLTTE